MRVSVIIEGNNEKHCLTENGEPVSLGLQGLALWAEHAQRYAFAALRCLAAPGEGLRAALLENRVPPKGMLRACAAQNLFRRWQSAGQRVGFSQGQAVVHAFSLSWWYEMHKRSGVEALQLRRMFPDWPHRWVQRLGWLRDFPQFLRYAAQCVYSPAQRFATLPLFAIVSLATRGVEAMGAYREPSREAS